MSAFEGGKQWLLVALFANSLRCNGASAAEGRPSESVFTQPMTRSGHRPMRRTRYFVYIRVVGVIEAVDVC